MKETSIKIEEEPYRSAEYLSRLTGTKILLPAELACVICFGTTKYFGVGVRPSRAEMHDR